MRRIMRVIHMRVIHVRVIHIRVIHIRVIHIRVIQWALTGANRHYISALTISHYHKHIDYSLHNRIAIRRSRHNRNDTRNASGIAVSNVRVAMLDLRKVRIAPDRNGTNYAEHGEIYQSGNLRSGRARNAFFLPKRLGQSRDELPRIVVGGADRRARARACQNTRPISR